MLHNHFFRLLTSCKQTLFAIVLMLPVFAIAQNTIAVAPVKLNVFYIGVDNPISVAASNSAEEKLAVEINGGGGKITKIGPGLYNVNVFSVTDECMLKVYSDGKLAGSSVFRVRALPAPEAAIGLYRSGSNIQAETFRQQAGVSLMLKNFPFEVKYEVISYTLTIDSDNGSLIDEENKGPVFSVRAKQIIDENIKSGRVVTIDRIMVRDASGKELKLPSLVYYIR